MKTELREYSVSSVLDGFVYNELEGRGLFGLSAGEPFSPSTSATTYTPPVSATLLLSTLSSRATRWDSSISTSLRMVGWKFLMASSESRASVVL